MIVIRATTLDGMPLGESLAAPFGATGGTIGRGDDNTLVLPDPERYISRVHAEVQHAPDGWRISNISSGNPFLHNHRRLAPGESALLHLGDEIHIGTYVLQVSPGEDDDAEHTVLHMPSVATVDPWNPGLTRPLSTVPTAPAARHTPAPRVPPPGARIGARQQAVTQDPPALPAEWDVFEPVAEPVSDTVPHLATPELDPMAGLHSTAGPSMTAMLGLSKPALGEDPIARFLAGDPASQRGSASDASSPTDALQMFREAAPDRKGARSPSVSAKPPFPPPQAALPRDTHPPRGSATARASRSPPPTNADALWSAFCEGSGVPVSLPQDLTPELMHTIGAVMRAYVQGTMRLVEARAATRHEMHVAKTMLQPRENNPLKFSRDVPTALKQLLLDPGPGFLEGRAAVDDAMDDLVAHAVGTLVGMRAVLDDALARIDPQKLEAKLPAPTLPERLLPTRRQARLWRSYLQHFEAVSVQAKDQGLFNKAFLQAYDRQLQQLDARHVRALNPME